MAQRQVPLSPLALFVLALLDEGAMYPYRMQQLIRERGKEDVVNVRHRASLYQTIARLERDGLVQVQGTSRTENRPERTLYRITRKGRETIQAWLRDMLATPAGEFPEFPAALSFIYLLDAKTARKELARRAEALDARLRRLAGVVDEHVDSVPRLFLLEVEYLRAMTAADLAWVHRIVEDLDRGRLRWNRKQIARARADAE